MPNRVGGGILRTPAPSATVKFLFLLLSLAPHVLPAGAEVETYPVGGGILERPLTLGISRGTGQFIGAVGTSTISYNTSAEFFTYRFELA